MGDLDSNIKNAKKNCGGPSGPSLCSQLVITAGTTNLKVKRSPKRAYSPFRQFSCDIANHFLGDSGSDVKNSIIFLDIFLDLGYASGWTSQPVWSIFKFKQASKCAYHPFRRFLCAIANHFWVIRSPMSKMPKNIIDVRQDLSYAAGWPSQPDRPIFKVKRAPSAHTPTPLEDFRVQQTIFWMIRIPTTKLSKILWKTVKTLTIHPVEPQSQSDPFSRSNQPRSAHTPLFRRFSCDITNLFLVILIPTSKIPKFFVEVRQFLVYAADWPSRLVWPFLRSNNPRSAHTPHLDNFCVL